KEICGEVKGKKLLAGGIVGPRSPATACGAAVYRHGRSRIARMVRPAAETPPPAAAGRPAQCDVWLQSDPWQRETGRARGFARGAVFHFSADSALSVARQEQFQAHFAAEAAVLETWSAEENWAPIVPCAPLRIFVSGRYRISKSLVPA